MLLVIVRHLLSTDILSRYLLLLVALVAAESPEASATSSKVVECAEGIFLAVFFI